MNTTSNSASVASLIFGIMIFISVDSPSTATPLNTDDQIELPGTGKFPT